MRMRKKPNLIPRMERCAHVLVADPAPLRGRWLSENGGYAKLYAELGCGKGRFTAETARIETDALIVAVERVPEAIVVAMERVCAESIENVRFLDRDASTLHEVFAEGELDRIYINFCDPWPGKRHAKRRLTFRNFLTLYKNLLKAEGDIHFKTDNLQLFEFSIEEFEHCGFILEEVTKNLHENGPVGVMTDYEAKFYGEGLPICRLVAKPMNEKD